MASKSSRPFLKGKWILKGGTTEVHLYPIANIFCGHYFIDSQGRPYYVYLQRILPKGRRRSLVAFSRYTFCLSSSHSPILSIEVMVSRISRRPT